MHIVYINGIQSHGTYTQGGATVLCQLCVLSICSSVSPEQWEGYSNENVIKTEQERNSSTTLRGVIHSVLEQTSQDLARQRAAVNLAFELRIREVTSAKETLEKHLEKVMVSG